MVDPFLDYSWQRPQGAPIIVTDLISSLVAAQAVAAAVPETARANWVETKPAELTDLITLSGQLGAAHAAWLQEP